MRLFLAGIDGLVGLLIFFAISIIGSWLQKKQREGQSDEMPAPPRRPTPTGTPHDQPQHPGQEQVSWEEELKRLLGGDTAETSAPPPPPPPIIIQAPRAPSPPIPVTMEAPEGEAEPAHRSVFEVTEERNPTEVKVEPSFRPLPALSESLQAYQEASELQRKVEAHLRRVTHHPVGMTSVRRRTVTPEATAALALLRNPRSARSAVLASLVLGPPRALAD